MNEKQSGLKSVELTPEQILQILQGAGLLYKRLRAKRRKPKKYKAGEIPFCLNLTHR